MRFFLFIFLCFVLSAPLSSQNLPFNNALKIRLGKRTPPGEVHTVLVQGRLAELLALQQKYNCKVNYISGGVASLSCELPALALLVQDGLVTRAEFTEARI